MWNHFILKNYYILNTINKFTYKSHCFDLDIIKIFINQLIKVF